jgi:hypothetical protein
MEDWRREPRNVWVRWWNDKVPRWVRDLTGIHPTTDVLLGGDAPPKNLSGFGRQGIWIIGAALIFAGYLLEHTTPYWSSGHARLS